MATTSVLQTHPPGTGWRDWCWPVCGMAGPSPYRHRYVEAWRREWQSVEVLRISDMAPEMNMANLWWRPLQQPRLEPEVYIREALKP